MPILEELRRRNVTRAAAAYGALAWLLIQVGDAVFAAFGFGEAAQRILILVLVIGFLPAMTLAWAFELTPEGLVREEALAADAPLRARTNRLLDRVIMGLLALAVSYFALDKFVFAPGREALRIEAASTRAAEQATRETLRDARGERSIVVLPFANLSSDPEQEYFSDGIAEEVLNLLARIPELSVISRTSAFAFKGKDTGIAEIARTLDVVYVLEGSVRKAGERVRITAQLIDARTDTHLWSETYDRTLEDVFAVQDDVAAKVVDQLQLKLLGDLPRAHTTDPRAHEHLLRARALLRSWVVEDVEAAVGQLQQAIAFDPDYAVAYALWGDALLIRGISLVDVPAARVVAAPLVEKALALEPELGEAYVTRAQLTDDPGAAETDLRHGLQLSPSYARGFEVLADLLSQQDGRRAEAFELIDRARSLDPLLPRNHHIKAVLHMQQGEWSEAEALEQQALALDPRFRAALVRLGNIRVEQGKFAEAVAYGERALVIDPRAEWVRSELQLVYMTLGDAGAASSLGKPGDPEQEMHLRFLAGDWKGAGELLFSLDEEALEHMEPRLVSRAALWHAARSGDFTGARTLIVERLGLAEPPAANMRSDEVMWFVDVSLVMAGSGDEATAKRLQHSVVAQLPELKLRSSGGGRSAHHTRALALALALTGDADAAIAALERANTPAPAPFWWLYPDHPGFDALRAYPRYQAVWDRVEAHNAHQRELLEQMRARGEVPRRGG